MTTLIGRLVRHPRRPRQHRSVCNKSDQADLSQPGLHLSHVLDEFTVGPEPLNIAAICFYLADDIGQFPAEHRLGLIGRHLPGSGAGEG